MEFGVVLQPDPPTARTVELAKRAETYGFSHAWLFDSHLLWQEPFPIFSRILNETDRIKVGTYVTNPATRDWTVLASAFATLNEMYGNRTVCGIGRGDSALRALGRRPAKLSELRQAIHVIRELASSRAVEHEGATLRFPWAQTSELEMWVAAYGPLALKLTGEVGDGFILQLADLDIAEWMIKTVRGAAEAAGRDPDAIKFCIGAPMYVGDGDDPIAREHMINQCRWFGGMVGNHVADIVAKYGGGSDVPAALTDYIAGRESYDYNSHGRATNTHTDFVPDEIVERFCIIGSPKEHIAKLDALKDLGVHQFAGYLQHDNKDATLAAYGNEIIPAVREVVLARS